MTFSLCLQIPNHIHFRRPLEIYANFIPQMIFLQSIFGYLVVCIIYKWTVDWSSSPTSPPSLLNMLIAMFLSPGEVKPEEQLYAGQSFVQLVLVLLAVVCIPWMLCTKPYFQWKEMRRIQSQGYIGLGQDGVPRESTDAVMQGEEEGNGRAIAEDMDEEHVRLAFAVWLVTHRILLYRNMKTLPRLSYTKSSTPLNSAWAAFRTQPHICVCGPYLWHMRSCPKCSGI